MENYTIYKATSPSNKVYIGMTKKSVDVRRKEHEYHSKNNKRKKIFHDALRKYELNFTWKALEIGLAKEEAEQKEIEYIAKFNATNRDFGYNQAKGGMAGDIMSEESRARWKQSMQRHYDDLEYIKKVSASKKKSLSEDPNSSEKQRSYIKNYFSNTINRQKHAIDTGGKPFICIETNEIFQSLALAAEKLETWQQNICKVLKGKRKYANGYSFKYLD